MNPGNPSLDRISVRKDEAPDEHTPRAFGEEDFYERSRNETLTARIHRRHQRAAYAWRLFVLLCLWITAVYALLILQGSQGIPFYLDDKVLIATIGSTTANVIGLFYVVAKYLFPAVGGPTPRGGEEEDDEGEKK